MIAVQEARIVENLVCAGISLSYRHADVMYRHTLLWTVSSAEKIHHLASVN
jgi:hypothetical protein